MAAEVVGGAFLTVSLEVLCGRMHSIMDFVRRNKVDAGLLKNLKIGLLSVKGVLNDAEKKQLTDPIVREWLRMLNDAIHDAEDLVDEINTEALRCEIEGGQSQSSKTGTWFYQVGNFVPSRLNVKDVERRINGILNTLKDIVEQKQHLGLSEVGVEPITSFRRSCATAWVEESDIYGRDADKQAIIDFLVSDEVDGDKLSVLPIVGMAGMGKTTLARLVYKEIDDKVMEKPFNIKAWITVSEESDVWTLTKKIYEEVTNSSSSTGHEAFKLPVQLKEFLNGQKILLVLDDVWNVDHKRWCDLRSSFESTTHGSKIIVTTRSAKVASDLGTVPKHDLPIISEEDCWKLFKKHAFDNVEASLDLDLEVIGRQIVQKCKGLPLAVKSLGSLLHSVQDPKDWKNVLNNDIWNLSEDNILPALWLSYYYLPPYLKRCFAYCSIFPKDYKIDKKHLILQWMAQGLLQPHERKMPEEVGEEYIKDLVSRSFFKYSRPSEDKITMHDLVNDLAMFASGECCLRLEDKYSDVFMRNALHVSSLACQNYDEKKLKDLYKNKVLRTLLNLDMHNVEHLLSMQFLRVLSLSRQFRIEELLNSIRNLKLLRYLDLSRSRLKEVPDTIGTLYNLQTLLLKKCLRLSSLPDSIGNLKHLRYLDLSNSSIEKLPDTICQLHELHTLILTGCKKLTHLSINNATDLINLHCFDIIGTGVREMPRQMSKLENLQKLTKFVVGRDSGYHIKELGELKDLHGDLGIEGLENVASVEDAWEANLIDKKHITALNLRWNGDTGGSVEAREVLDGLQPHSDLKDLTIYNYGGTTFAHWVGRPSFSCMKAVRLVDCKNCFMLPPLGQLPSLEWLEIRGLDKVVRIGDEFYSDGSLIAKPFKSLKFLSFSKMELWEEWALVEAEDGGVFTNLKELRLEHCPKLKGASCLPDYLPSLETLKIKGTSHHLVASLSNCRYPSLSLLRIGGCYKMKTFPGGTLPSNIQKIKIWECPELVSLSEEGWPSNLKSLEIQSCRHSMQWNLGMLTSLTSLDIGRINEAMYSFPKQTGQLPTTLTSFRLSCLKKLKSLNGSALQHLTSLKYLSVEKCRQIQCLPQQGLPATLSSLHLVCLPKLESLNGDTFRHLTSFQHLTIEDCPQLTCLPQQGLPTTLTSLRLVGLPKLESLNGDTCRHLTSFQHLTIEDCPWLQCLPQYTQNTQKEVYPDVQDANLKEDQSTGWRDDTDDIKNIQEEVSDTFNPPTELQKLNLSFWVRQKLHIQQYVYGAKSFPSWGGYGSFSCLVKVDLVYCKSCYCLPPLGLLPSLKKLHIQGFDKVERIGEEFYSTDTLSLSKPFKFLESLTFSHMLWWREWSFMKSGVFSDLKQLTLDNCRELEGKSFPNCLPSLKSLFILGCKQEVVASLSTGGLPLLSFLKIGHCKGLASFPIGALPANVDTVKIMGCKELVSLSEDGWPSKLKSLEISYCGKLFGNSLWWNLRTLTSLTSIQIIKIDEVVDSFPEEWQLPTTLKSLTLRHFRNLKSLNGKALQHHTSLTELKIEFCHHLHYLPEEGLPDSLSQLEIFGCGFLNERCQKDRGEDWPKISHIPRILIDCEEI